MQRKNIRQSSKNLEKKHITRRRLLKDAVAEDIPNRTINMLPTITMNPPRLAHPVD